MHGPLFFPGTDDELVQVQGDLVEDERAEEVAGTDGEDDDVGGFNEDDEGSPLPTNMARRLQKPRTEFVFDDLTGDFDPYPTIFLPRRSVIQEQNQRRSARPHASTLNPTAAYLKVNQGSKSDSRKKRKDTKGKDKATDPSVSLKRTRDDDDGASNVKKPATKKLKSKDTKTADDKGT